MTPPLQAIDAVLDTYSGRSRRVLEYSQRMKTLVDAAKEPSFDESRWDELGAYLDTAVFERVGNFKEVMDWPTYRAFLHQWARGSGWECSFKRVTEQGNVVLLELEERSTLGGTTSAVNSVSVYEFAESGAIRHLDIYLQMPMPDPAMLESYQGHDIHG